MNLTDEAVTAAAKSQVGLAWTHLDESIQAALCPQIVAEVIAAFRLDLETIWEARRSGAAYIPSDAAVMAAIETAAVVHAGWNGFADVLKDLLMDDYRNEIAAAASAQYKLQAEGSR